MPAVNHPDYREVYSVRSSFFVILQNNSRAAVDKARHTVARFINAGMSDFDKEKKLHDYIVNNTKYDYENYLNGTLPYESFNPYGALVSGKAVCEGYAKSMKLLCDLSSLDCIVVSGKFKSGSTWEGHAWNIVKIDGKYYHLDVTNDDPVSKDGTDILAYYYFNLNDSEMAKAGSWDRSAYPACTSMENNYYYKNNIVTNNRDEFNKALQEALASRRQNIEIRISDYSRDKYSDITDLIFNAGEVLKYYYSIQEEFGIIRIYNIQYV